MLQVAIPTCAIVGTVQGRGYVRAFCTGAALPSSFGVIPWWQFVGANFASGGPFSNLLSVGAFEKDQTTFVWATALLTGLACVGFYWLIRPTEKD